MIRDKILAHLHHISPLSKSQEDRLLSEVEQVAKSSIFGSFATALVQGVLGGIAMYICGFPALLWGAIIAFASFIPIIGTAIIWLPFAIYLFITGNWEYGAFLVGWGICVIGMVDNFLRPMLMKGSGDDNMSTLIIFLSLLGGINYFGLLGLIYGPMVFSITIVFLRLYEMNFKNFLTDQDNS